jgi:hypothetical protein
MPRRDTLLAFDALNRQVTHTDLMGRAAPTILSRAPQYDALAT